MKEVHQRQQRLNPREETAIVNWLLRLQAWGWPARVEKNGVFYFQGTLLLQLVFRAV